MKNTVKASAFPKPRKRRRRASQQTRVRLSRSMQAYWNRVRREQAHQRAVERREARTRMTPEESARQRRDRRMRNTHGISIEQFEALAAHQGQNCAICRDAATLCVDRDPETALVRGLLCRCCSSTLKMFENDAEALARAESYLTSPPAGAQWAPSSYDPQTGEILSNEQVFALSPIDA